MSAQVLPLLRELRGPTNATVHSFVLRDTKSSHVSLQLSCRLFLLFIFSSVVKILPRISVGGISMVSGVVVVVVVVVCAVVDGSLDLFARSTCFFI